MSVGSEYMFASILVTLSVYATKVGCKNGTFNFHVGPLQPIPDIHHGEPGRSLTETLSVPIPVNDKKITGGKETHSQKRLKLLRRTYIVGKK